MELAADANLPFSRDVVFAAYRDHLTELLPFLPNVRSIEPRSRVEEGAIVEVVTVWHGGGDIPAAARAMIHEAMLAWTDYARWDGERFTCDWRIETKAKVFREAVTCHGRNVFTGAGEGTHLQIRGTLEIDAAKVRGVPRLFASQVSRVAEKMLASKIQPNLSEMGRGLQGYLGRPGG
jgi:hypothetical protein